MPMVAGRERKMKIDRRSLLAGSAALSFAVSAPAILRAQEKPAKIRIGLVRLISSGPIFIAEARKLFEKVNLEAELKYFADGALAMPALVAGELDLTATTLNAGLFNTVAKGAPFKLILDRGSEKPGHGSMTIVASNAMYEQGYKSANDGAKLKGKMVAIQAPGSIDQYLLGRAAEKANLNPRSDINWSSGMPYPDMIKLMGAGRADVANIPVPLAFLAEKNQVGKIVGPGSDIEPDAQLACWVMSSSYLASNKSAAIRFAMVHTHAARLFNKAAADKDPDVVNIISEATKVPAPLIAAAAPRWTWYTDDGLPNVESVMAQFKFFSQSMGMVSGAVSADTMFDFAAAKEAAQRLKTANPFT
jgi:NitT/TauT family transport system substrate-binding protein